LTKSSFYAGVVRRALVWCAARCGRRTPYAAAAPRQRRDGGSAAPRRRLGCQSKFFDRADAPCYVQRAGAAQPITARSAGWLASSQPKFSRREDKFSYSVHRSSFMKIHT